MGEIADMELESAYMNDEGYFWDVEANYSHTQIERRHRTKDREEMSIMEMADSHLNNTIMMILRKTLQKREAVDKANKSASSNAFQNKLRGRKEIDIDEAAESINRNVILVGLYITDAVRRGMDVSAYTKYLQQIYAE